ncbi:hypothetical protein [Stenotrophomonas sp. 24(2023)]|uniref:hypothetical protein n=1 Tax=Stenotrophomonas sp. 24(2023) TaxID=3068324 RepID=UPI0027DF1105|nr:hypothetical protein [Stenotrophomonas sp. 24(2023)]WMJ71415.1 hypothetical protein Q9R17_04285 [Stenotrophomonas sp. 24(2023)]
MRTCRLLPLLVLAGCAGPGQLTTVDTRSENVGHQRLNAQPAGGGSGQVQAYQLAASEGYRMPQLHVAPDPVVGERDPRRELAPTTVCLQVVVNADGRVERSLPLADRAECLPGNAVENAPLLQAAQAAVAQWQFSPAAVCHFGAGPRPPDRGDCDGAERVEPVAVSLLYAFTFEIVHGQQTVRTQGR